MKTPEPAVPAPGIVNPLDGRLGYQLRRASAVMLADLAQSLDDMALTPVQTSILLLIARNPGITQSEIGRVLGIKRANMAPLAAHLTERALIHRTAADGRSQRLWLRDAGVTTTTELDVRIADHEARFLPDLTTTARNKLVESLRAVWMGSPTI